MKKVFDMHAVASLSDDTFGYNITVLGELTVQDAIAYILTKNEWGKVECYIDGRVVSICSYDRNGVCSYFEEGVAYLDRKIVKGSANGGWGCMDYRFIIG